MSLLSIAWKNIHNRSLSSILTSFSIALGVALMIATFVFYEMAGNLFTRAGRTSDLVIGPKGSKVDLVLNSIYRVSPPIENLPWRYYEVLKEDRRIESAIPLALGDRSEKGNFPIVGTTVDYFMQEVVPGEPFQLQGEESRLPTGQWESVIGANVAIANNWKPGDQFQMVHSGQGIDAHVHDEKFTIVGILGPTGTPDDRTVFVNLEGFFGITGHGKPIQEAVAREADFFGETIEQVRRRYAVDIAAIEAHEAAHNAAAETDQVECNGFSTPLQQEVTAILVNMKSEEDKEYMSSSRAISLKSELQEGFQAQAVNAGNVMTKLMKDLVGNIQLMMLYLTGVIIIVSGVGVFVSIYNTMAERRKEIAVMRALGAGRTTVLLIIMLETFVLCVGGGTIGWLLGHGMVFAANPMVQMQTGLVLQPWAFTPLELSVFPILMLLAILIGILPGLSAYNTDVANNLT